MKLRTDVIFTWLAIESILIAIATPFCFPWWVSLIAAVVFAFSVFEMVVSIIRKRKSSYDEVQGKKTYRYPVGTVILGTLVLICFTTALVLCIKQLFGFALIALALMLLILGIIALVKKWRVLRFISWLLLIAILFAGIAYGMAHLVHKGLDLNPGLKAEQPNDQQPDNQQPDNQQPDNQQPDNQQPDNQQPDNQQPGNQQPGNQQPDNQQPGNQQPDNQQPDNQQPEVTVKINAPETMKYGTPVSVTLEGATVENLLISNKDFLSVVKVSDTEVVLTLVGIVNDAGEVEFVPAAGYITVTDSVTGTNVSINIVE